MTPVIGSNKANAANPAAGSSSIMICSDPYAVEEIASGESTPSAIGLDRRSCWSWSLIIGRPRKTRLHRSANDGAIRSSPASCDIQIPYANPGYFYDTTSDPGQSLRLTAGKRALGAASTAVWKPSLRNLDGLRVSLSNRPGRALWIIRRQCSVGKVGEPFESFIGLVVDTAKRTLLGQVAPRVQPGHQGLAVRAARGVLPGGLLGQQGAGVDVPDELGQREQPRLGNVGGQFGPGGDGRFEILDAAAHQPGGFVVVGHRDRVMQSLQQRLMGADALDPAPHVQAQDVVGTLPDRVDLSIAQKPCHRPCFDTAVAAVDLDRVGGHGDAEPAHLEFGDRHRNALSDRTWLAVVGKPDAVEHQRLGGFD